MRKILQTASLCVFATSGTLAQSSPQTELAVHLAADSTQLRQYSWTTRSEARIDGRQVAVSLDKMRYDLDGRLQKTAVGGSGQPTAIQQDWIEAVHRIALDYVEPEAGRTADFLRRADIWEGRAGSGEGTLRIEGRGFFQDGDRVDLRAVGGRPDRLEAEATLDGAPVYVLAEFRRLSGGGPSYVARLTARYPARSLELQLENFDYQHDTALADDARSVSAPAGTELRVRLAHALSSEHAHSGQSFEAILDRDLIVDSVTVAVRGSIVTGRVVEAEGSGRVSGRARLALALAELRIQGEAVPVATDTLVFEAESTRGRDAKRVGVATGVGTIIGVIAGGGKGAAIGAGVGAGVGAGTTILTKGDEVEFNAEQIIVFRLGAPLERVVK